MSTVQDVDVSIVQEILVGTFAQRVHGPPGNSHPHAPPYKGPSSWTVAGAGLSTWNGVYHRKVGGVMFVQAGEPTHALYAQGDVWRLAVEGKELFYTGAQPDPDKNAPPLKGWVVAVGGKAPAPHLVAGEER